MSGVKTFSLVTDAGKETVSISCEGDLTLVPRERWLDVADAIGLTLKADLEEAAPTGLKKLLKGHRDSEFILNAFIKVRGVQYAASKLSHLGHFSGPADNYTRDVHR